MKLHVFASALAAVAVSVCAADSGAKQEVIQAAKALAQKPNYSWHQTVKVPEGNQFRPGPTDGKTEKNGATLIKMTRRDSDMRAVFQGNKSALETDDGWQSAAELENSEGRGRFIGRMLRNFKAPAEQAQELANDSKDLKKEGDAWTGELSEEGAKNVMMFGGRGRNGGPEISGAKGTVKFWANDGTLSKYEYHVEGKVNFNGNDVDIDRTTTVEIKDVGTTKVEVPEGAKKKLS